MKKKIERKPPFNSQQIAPGYKWTKAKVLEVAEAFWKNCGHLTFFKTKKQYFEYVVNNYNVWKKQGDKFLKERQKHVLKDLDVRERQADEYLKAKKKTEQIEKALKEKIKGKKDTPTESGTF